MSKKLLLMLCLTVLLSGCAGNKNLIKNSGQGTSSDQTKQDEPEVRFADWQSVAQIKMINFDYDKSDLLEPARAILKENAKFLQANPSVNVLVEGHCDERGTVEYNLSLGQKRAAAVREYYGRLGIALNRIATISYGHEKPLDPGHSEEAWAKNRRAETKVRTAK